MVKYRCIDISSSNGASNAKKCDSQLLSNGGLFTPLDFHIFVTRCQNIID